MIKDTEETARLALRQAREAMEVSENFTVLMVAMRILMPFAMVSRIPDDDEVEAVIDNFMSSAASATPEFRLAVRSCVQDTLSFAENLRRSG